MICYVCKEAGKANQEGDEEKAERIHKGCEFPKSCCCQHRVGKNN